MDLSILEFKLAISDLVTLCHKAVYSSTCSENCTWQYFPVQRYNRDVNTNRHSVLEEQVRTCCRDSDDIHTNQTVNAKFSFSSSANVGVRDEVRILLPDLGYSFMPIVTINHFNGIKWN